MEVQRLPKYDPGSRHLLTVVDALTKYAWVLPLKKETGTESVKAFEKVLKNGEQRPMQLRKDHGQEFYNQTFQNFLKKETFITFSHTGMPKQPCCNGSIGHSKGACKVTLRQPIPYGMTMCCSHWY